MADSLRTAAVGELMWAETVLDQLYVYDSFGQLHYRGFVGLEPIRRGTCERAHQRLLAMRLELRRRMRGRAQGARHG